MTERGMPPPPVLVLGLEPTLWFGMLGCTCSRRGEADTGDGACGGGGGGSVSRIHSSIAKLIAAYEPLPIPDEGGALRRPTGSSAHDDALPVLCSPDCPPGLSGLLVRHSRRNALGLPRRVAWSKAWTVTGTSISYSCGSPSPGAIAPFPRGSRRSRQRTKAPSSRLSLSPLTVASTSALHWQSFWGTAPGERRPGNGTEVTVVDTTAAPIWRFKSPGARSTRTKKRDSTAAGTRCRSSWMHGRLPRRKESVAQFVAGLRQCSSSMKLSTARADSCQWGATYHRRSRIPPRTTGRLSLPYCNSATCRSKCGQSLGTGDFAFPALAAPCCAEQTSSSRECAGPTTARLRGVRRAWVGLGRLGSLSRSRWATIS